MLSGDGGRPRVRVADEADHRWVIPYHSPTGDGRRAAVRSPRLGPATWGAICMAIGLVLVAPLAVVAVVAWFGDERLFAWDAAPVLIVGTAPAVLGVVCLSVGGRTVMAAVRRGGGRQP